MPELPLGIAEHDGVLWVCGANEMIASSADGGEHWTMRNQDRRGEMLFTLAFVGNKIEAFGSGGAWLVSDDGGIKWRRNQIQPTQDLEHIAFGSDKDVFGANASAFGWSHDGGAHWQFAAYEYSGQYGPIAIAALDAQHAALLYSFDGEPKQPAFQSVLLTTDGGLHWKTTHLDARMQWTSMRVVNGHYWLVGTQGPSPAATSSAEGTSWQMESSPPDSEDSCTAQGCLLPGGWADLRDTAVHLWQVPHDSSDSSWGSWAATGITFCYVGVALHCRKGQESWESRPSGLHDTSKTPGGVIAALCLSCPPPVFPITARLNHHQGKVVLHALIGPTGTIEQLRVQAAGWAVLAQAAVETVRNWKYQPLLLNGKPVPVDTTIAVKFELKQ